MCYQRTGQLERALEEYEAALKIDPDYAEAWNNVGALHHAAGDLDKAIDGYRRALALKKLASTYQNLGAAYLRQEKVREAFDAYRAAYALSPAVFASGGVQAAGGDLATQYYYFAKLFAADGQVEQAITYLEKAREQGFSDMAAVSADPDFAGAVDNPRFVALIQPQS
jgi:tetratricopeptide (TPR) repeat protein